MRENTRRNTKTTKLNTNKHKKTSYLMFHHLLAVLQY